MDHFNDKTADGFYNFFHKTSDLIQLFNFVYNVDRFNDKTAEWYNLQ